jgi:hypothetical protein
MAPGKAEGVLEVEGGAAESGETQNNRVGHQYQLPNLAHSWTLAIDVTRGNSDIGVYNV